MNSRQLKKLGVPPDCVKPAIAAIQLVRRSGDDRGRNLKTLFKSVLTDPSAFVTDKCLGGRAQAILEDRDFVRPQPVSYRTWGEEGIDEASHAQMRQACSVPVAAAAALMPDAHVGYGLPIGGVLACENAVIPYAVGVDIGCRMKLSVLYLQPDTLEDDYTRYKDSLES